MKAENANLTKEEKKSINYWEKKKKRLEARQLIQIVIEISYTPIREKVVEEFLKLGNLVFDDFRRMAGAAKDIFENNPRLNDEFYKQLLDFATSDNLVELIFEEDVDATPAKELFRRIDWRLMGDRKSKQIMTALFTKITNPRSRIEILKRLIKLELNERELTELLEIATKAMLIEAMDKIRKAITAYKKKKIKNDKIVSKLKKFCQKIKQKQE